MVPLVSVEFETPAKVADVTPSVMSKKKLLIIASLVVLVGAVIRLSFLPLTGTDDHPTFKLWSYVASTNPPEGIYRVRGDIVAPLNTDSLKRILNFEIVPGGWEHAGWSECVDYPPLIPLMLGVVGKVYSLFSPNFADSSLINALVKLPAVCADALISLLIFFCASRRRTVSIALFASSLFWLNPMSCLASSLYAYVDSVYILPLVVCLLLATEKRFVPAWFFYTLSIFCKPQPLVVFPALLAASIAQGFSAVLGGAVVSVFVGLCIMAPYIVHGTVTNLIANNFRNASEPFISGQQCNFWWLTTYAIEVHRNLVFKSADLWTSLQLKPQMMSHFSFGDVLGSNMHTRKISMIVFGLYNLLILWTWCLQRGKQMKSALCKHSLPECCALLLYGQAMLLTQSHENHLYGPAALVLATWWLGNKSLDRQLLYIGIALSSIVTLNLITFYGLGPDVKVPEFHNLFWFDFSVVLSVANVCLFIFWLTRWIRMFIPKDSIECQSSLQ